MDKWFYVCLLITYARVHVRDSVVILCCLVGCMLVLVNYSFLNVYANRCFDLELK